MSELSERQLQQILQGVQSAEQAVQDVKQSLLSAGVISKDQATGKANLGFEDVTHDNEIPEAFTSKAYNDSEMWTFNKKQIAASEQTERTRSIDLNTQLGSLELARKEHDFAMQQARDNLALRVSEDAQLVKHMLNVEYAKFNSATSEPINPNIGQSDPNTGSDA